MKPKKSIEYAELSWNPFSGCLNWDNGVCAIGKDCWAYNRAKMLANNPKVKGYSMPDFFKPTFHPEKLDMPLRRKKPAIIAVAFMGDIAYCKVNSMWQIKQVMKNCPQHTFLMLTKLPEELRYDLFPHNAWLGVTVNKQDEVHRIETLKNIRQASHKWVSFEPPYEKIDCELTGIDFIAIGGLTGRTKFQPDGEVVDWLIHNARVDDVKVVIKDNLDYEPKASYKRWEWP